MHVAGRLSRGMALHAPQGGLLVAAAGEHIEHLLLKCCNPKLSLRHPVDLVERFGEPGRGGSRRVVGAYRRATGRRPLQIVGGPFRHPRGREVVGEDLDVVGTMGFYRLSHPAVDVEPGDRGRSSYTTLRSSSCPAAKTATVFGQQAPVDEVVHSPGVTAPSGRSEAATISLRARLAVVRRDEFEVAREARG